MLIPFVLPLIGMLVSLVAKKPKALRACESVLGIELIALGLLPSLENFITGFQLPIIYRIMFFLAISIATMLFFLAQIWKPLRTKSISQNYTEAPKNSGVNAFARIFSAPFRNFGICTKTRLIQALAIITAIALVIGISPIVYEKVIAVVKSDINLLNYTPFGDNKDYDFHGTRVKSLDSPSTLSFHDNFKPVFYGIEQYYPLTSAFVRATYPMNAYHPYGPKHDDRIFATGIEPKFAILLLVEKEADVSLVRKFDVSEADAEKLLLTPIGRDALVFVANSKNPITNLTQDDIRQIYAGQITNWQDLGGNNEKIRLYQPPGDPKDYFERLMGDSKALDPEMRIADLSFNTKPSYFVNHKNAIGYTSIFFLDMDNHPGIKALSVDGVAPTAETIRSGEYPLSVDICAATRIQANRSIDEFVNWMLSPQGQELVEKTGYVKIR
ncbi:MAG: substrate-binding domain-containing protein [Clostridiales bacterium]|nr:substrate-binding domain-containing protein [Clostridiales bacterium]